MDFVSLCSNFHCLLKKKFGYLIGIRCLFTASNYSISALFMLYIVLCYVQFQLSLDQTYTVAVKFYLLRA